MKDDLPESVNPVEILQNLIRFNTVNPPGNETECIRYIHELLCKEGIETKMVGRVPERLNLVARLEGRGEAPPFLMYGHADVVTVEYQNWKHDPFGAVSADGCIWGRGALDMKGALAMMISAMLLARRERFVPAGDILLAVVCDEEDGGAYGAGYLVEQHADLFQGVCHAIGEIGGFTMHMGEKRFYPIMIAEKQHCLLKTVIKGPAGHGSMPMRGGAMAKLGRLLQRLDTGKLPVHVTQPVRLMIEAMASHMSPPANIVLRSLLNPVLTDTLLHLLGEKGNFLAPILHNTVNATIVRGGNKVNVIPGEITLEFDGRVLPGYGAEDLVAELGRIAGPGYEFEVTCFERGPGEVKLNLFDTLAEILCEMDSGAIPIPFVISAVTDARHFARLGIQTYGFTPMLIPKGMDFSKLIHAADERIPIDGLKFGSDAVYRLIKRYTGA